MTILGTRPEVIRLCRVISKLDERCDHVLVHTGQNYDRGLNGIFFEELGVRRPDHSLGVSGGSLGGQIGQILERSEAVITEERPERVLILGDTNSCLSAIMAKRMGIPVYHMEAGNRCFDDRVPEEVNRRIVDHTCDVHLPYTERSRANLLAEGLPSRDIYVIGNPIGEVIKHYQREIDDSSIMERLGLERAGYFLVTLHRAENVDDLDRLGRLIAALERVSHIHALPVIISTHPRTADRLKAAGISMEGKAGLSFLPPFGFFDFVSLERAARCVLTDSGTAQEECCILGVPSVTLRDTTERPETVECGSNLLAGSEPDDIARAVQIALELPPDWIPPPEYLIDNVSDKVVRLLLSFR
jgi:UDP-N-acetylglucosamine 2-epimerase (non-hydrolysing)